MMLWLFGRCNQNLYGLECQVSGAGCQVSGARDKEPGLCGEVLEESDRCRGSVIGWQNLRIGVLSEVSRGRYKILPPEMKPLMPIRSFRDLTVWQKSMDLVVESYKLTRLLPGREMYGLACQIQRSAVSVPANIAEGHGREHLGDYLHHLSVANGSLMELETHLLLASRLSYVPMKSVEPLLNRTSEVGRMLAGLFRSLKKAKI
jgi:four helix bundle protein